ncbi:MAG: DUF512 domain-containing protein [Ruminococcaceae bacterium]|nr:DUF512 domain-containing protein [Oscillospiraceae bacterium]
MVEITEVRVHSRAAKMGILSGDVLFSINGHEINDVLDYRFYLAEKKIELLLKRDGEEYSVLIQKGEYDDIGLEFATPLMDQKHRCENKCIFCFIDQNPKGMRESIYFKDDDSRLSFLHGNYITLTNLNSNDIQRIINMHISPVNVSVHTTNPQLRVMMMKNKRSGEVLSYLRTLSDAGIKLRGQIVLCKGVNDGAELERSMNDLCEYYPSLDSVSVVPAGLTAYRDGLYPLEPFSAEECADVIRQVTDFGDKCIKKYGERIFYVSDEFYVKSGTPLPDYEFWGDFSQIENGVGMLSSFEYEFMCALSTLDDEEKKVKRKVSIATGYASFELINSLCNRLMEECADLEINVYKIKNNFFGGEVTVTGLLTGTDIEKQLSGRELGETLYLSQNVLRSEGDLFLCGMTPEKLSEKLETEIVFTQNDGGDFLYKLCNIDV